MSDSVARPTVRIGIAQTHPVIGDVAGNVERVAELVAQAVAQGAQLVVLPELMTTGYVFDDKAELFGILANGDGLAELAELSRAHSIVLVAGVALRRDHDALNCAVLVDSGELKATYVKAHSWDTEKLIFTAGDSLPPVVETRLGRIGLAVCYDLEFPELIRHLALNGAEIVAAPTNWPAGFEAPHPGSPFNAEMIRVMGNASTNRVAIAVACRTGGERGVEWVDRSVIIGADGFVIAEAEPGIRVIVSDVDLEAVRDKNVSPRNHVLNDRRTDLY